MAISGERKFMDLIKKVLEINKRNLSLWIFVLTGGPCGGKTTALSRMVQFLRDRRYKVITVPETATKFLSNGVHFGEGELPPRIFQEEIFLDILEQENRFIGIAER